MELKLIPQGLALSHAVSDTLQRDNGETDQVRAGPEPSEEEAVRGIAHSLILHV